MQCEEVEKFILREGTELAKQQETFETALREEGQAVGIEEKSEPTLRMDEQGEVDSEEEGIEADQEEELG